jgi:hypothetical protein
MSAFTNQTQIDENYVNQFFSELRTSNYAVLKLAVSKDDNELGELYANHVRQHNESLERALFPNSGFDLFFPEKTDFDRDFAAKFVDLKVKGEMIYCDKNMEVEKTYN